MQRAASEQAKSAMDTIRGDDEEIFPSEEISSQQSVHNADVPSFEAILEDQANTQQSNDSQAGKQKAGMYLFC